MEQRVPQMRLERPPFFFPGPETALCVFKTEIQKSLDFFGIDSEKVQTFWDLPCFVVLPLLTAKPLSTV